MDIKLSSTNSTYIFPPKLANRMEITSRGGEMHSIFINNKKIGKIEKNEKKVINIANKGEIQLFIDPFVNKNNFSLYVTFYNYEDIVDEVYTIIYTPITAYNGEYFFGSHQKNINNDFSSFMVLRTNPKLTGNIKLVIDSEDKIYLDTFQINSLLANEKYRHIPIPLDSIFANDVRNYFSDIPKEDFYKISEENCKLFNPQKELHNQFIDTYFYGVKNNFDKLYKENFSLLAPLYINDYLPDFFLIFRVDGPVNNYLDVIDDKDIFNKFISEGKLIKSVDLRKDTPIGNYLRNIQTSMSGHPTSIYLSMNQYNHNEWTGISIDRGVVTTATESGYFLTEVKNQVDYDRYITNGFERNGLISGRLINLEFMFDDKECDDFKINRYFGIYVINHEITKIQKEGLNESLKSLISNLTDYNTKIFNITSDNIFNDFCRVNTIEDCYEYLLNKDKINPHNNILTSICKYNNIKNTYIMNLNINNHLNSGEHLRIIDKNKKTIYEVIVSKCDTDNFYEKNKDVIINYKKYNNKKITYYRTIISDTEDKNQQINQIYKSFKKLLPKNIEVYKIDNNISFIIREEKDNNYYFQRICSKVLYDSEENSIEKNNSFDEDITYFLEKIKNSRLKIFNNKLSNTQSILDLSLFLPINFETWNDRLTYIINFLYLGNDDIYNINSYIDNSNKLLLNIDEDNNYEELKQFNISYHIFNDNIITTKSITKNSIISPNTKNNYIIKSYTNNNKVIEKVNIYTNNNYSFNVSGILPIKDFNFDVIDNTNIIQSKEKYIKIKTIDEYTNDKKIKDKNIKGIRGNNISPENFYQYIDLNNNDNILHKNTCIKKVNDLYNKNHKNIDIPLITPTNCKWKLYGKDILNNDIKSSPFSPQAYSYYLQISNSNYNIFSEEINEENDISNIIEKNYNNLITIRDYLLYDDGNAYDFLNQNAFVKMYYNNISKTLDGIFCGQKIQLINNNIDLSIYDGYMLSIAKSKTTNISTSPIEFIIDENKKVILGIWYIGNYYDNSWVKSNNISNLSNIYNNKYIPFTNCDDIKIDNKKIFLSLLNSNSIENENNKSYTYNFDIKKSNNYAVSQLDENILMSGEDDNINILSPTIKNTKNNSLIFIKNEDDLFIKNDIHTFKKIVENSTINLYIKSNNIKKYSLSLNFIEPINIRESLPLKIFNNEILNEYYSYNGYIQPEFKNIFEFEQLDSSLSKETNITFIGSNTSIKKINKIGQIWFNKVSEDANYSYKEGNASKKYSNLSNYFSSNAILSLDVEKNVSVIRTCWEDNFYKIYKREKTVTNKNGYESIKDVKTFFGSHAMVVKQNSITISNWENCYTIVDDRKKYSEYNDKKIRKILSLNITDAMINYLKTITNILDNWAFDKKSLNYCEKYINNIIENIYNINLNNNIEIFRGKKQNNKISIKPFNEKEFKKINNINTDLVVKNNKYYLNIDLIDDGYDYAIKYTIKK